MEKIIITIPAQRDKPSTIEVNGVKGELCKTLTAGIEAAMGTVVSEEATQEMYEQPEEVSHHLRQGQG